MCTMILSHGATMSVAAPVISAEAEPCYKPKDPKLRQHILWTRNDCLICVIASYFRF
jgi:hypothetical protein